MKRKIFCLAVLVLASIVFDGCVQPPPQRQESLSITLAELNMAQGVEAFAYSNYAAAKNKFNNALKAYRGIDDPEGTTRACLSLSETLIFQGDVGMAQNYLDQAKHIAEREGFSHYLERIDIITSSIAMRENRLQDALSILQKYLAPEKLDTLSTAEPSSEVMLAALQSMVYLSFSLENIDSGTWIAHYEKALSKLNTPSPHNIARLYRFKAMLLHRQGASEKSDSFFEQALDIYRNSSSRGSIAAALTEWAGKLIEQTRLHDAEDRLERALAIRGEMRDKNGCREVLLILERVNKLQGDNIGEKRVSKWLEEVEKPGPGSWPDPFLERNKDLSE